MRYDNYSLLRIYFFPNVAFNIESFTRIRVQPNQKHLLWNSLQLNPSEKCTCLKVNSKWLDSTCLPNARWVLCEPFLPIISL